MRVVWQALEAAKNIDNQEFVAACRRLIEANRLGQYTECPPSAPIGQIEVIAYYLQSQAFWHD